MTEEDLAAVRRVYDEWSVGNWAPRFDFYDEAMEWGWSDEFPGLAGVYHDPAERRDQGRPPLDAARGKVIRLEIFATRERALADVGLAPDRARRG
jgi:hypothetical protein